MAHLPWVPVLTLAVLAHAGERPLITFTPPAADEDERPLATAIYFGPQGTDYAFRIEFDREPTGAGCRSRCANTTLFLDTDNSRSTGLKLTDTRAPEAGADLAITVQGVRELEGERTVSKLKVKVLQYGEGASSVEGGVQLAELEAERDTERVLVDGKTVFILVDGNDGTIPAGKKARVVYHPPSSPPLSGVGKGLNAPGVNRVEVFKKGKLSNPSKGRSDYEKL